MGPAAVGTNNEYATLLGSLSGQPIDQESLNISDIQKLIHQIVYVNSCPPSSQPGGFSMFQLGVMPGSSFKGNRWVSHLCSQQQLVQPAAQKPSLMGTHQMQSLTPDIVLQNNQPVLHQAVHQLQQQQVGVLQQQPLEQQQPSLQKQQTHPQEATSQQQQFYHKLHVSCTERVDERKSVYRYKLLTDSCNLSISCSKLSSSNSVMKHRLTCSGPSIYAFPAPAFAAALPPSSSEYFDSKAPSDYCGPATNSETTGFSVQLATRFTSFPGAAVTGNSHGSTKFHS
ncbi:unnamed protein product [Sphagnum troendelagicum]|uniref:Uncharacterized protein n=1 Tax=Sphagnum troendelagicum TaxID=128251 RepID=A0ABP0TGF8_9BRYO